MTTYQVYDRQTGKLMGKPVSSLSQARKKVDRLDNEYGGYRYGYKRVEGV